MGIIERTVVNPHRPHQQRMCLLKSGGGMGEDWGVVDESDLFSAAGSTKSLDDLVESLTTGVAVTEPRFPLATGRELVQVIQQDAASMRQPSAPKILKIRPKTVLKQPTAKRVTFDVQKLAARESTGAAKEDAAARLALQLGALPAKNKAINYKALKDDRRRSKAAAKEQSIMKLTRPNFKKTNRKNGKKQRTKK